MTARICLIIAAVLASAATASAQVDGPAIPAAAAPTAACKPSKRVVCGPAAPPALSAAVGRYQQTLGSTRVHRGLGLPSPRRPLGRAGARAQALADGRSRGRVDSGADGACGWRGADCACDRHGAAARQSGPSGP